MSVSVPNKGEHDSLRQYVYAIDRKLSELKGRVADLEQMAAAYEPEPAVKHAVPLPLYEVLEAAVAWCRSYNPNRYDLPTPGSWITIEGGIDERINLNRAVERAERAGLL